MSSSKTTFTEWLFGIVLPTPGNEGDIVKKFAGQNNQQREWPIHATQVEELIQFFTEQAFAQVAAIGSALNRELVNRDFDDYMRLLSHHHAQIQAHFKSSVFALRTAWKDYEAYVGDTCKDEGCPHYNTPHSHSQE